MTGLDYAIVIGFLAIMGAGGFFLSRLIRNADDFFVAGRELTPFILCAAITATNLSMLHVVGMGGTAYLNGVSTSGKTSPGASRWCFRASSSCPSCAGCASDRSRSFSSFATAARCACWSRRSGGCG